MRPLSTAHPSVGFIECVYTNQPKLFPVTSDGSDNSILHSHPVQQSANDRPPRIGLPLFSADLFSKFGWEESASLISFISPETGAY